MKRRIALILFATAALVALGGLAMLFAAKTLKTQVEQALGPASEIGAIALRWNAVEITDLRIKGPPGWPAADTLRAGRITVTPDLGSLLSGQLRVAAIVIEEGYVSALRGADGKLRVVPSLLERQAPEGGQGAAVPPLTIGRIELRNSALGFYDATLRGKRAAPFEVRLENLAAHVTALSLPGLDEMSQLLLDGTVKGQRGDGHLHVEGAMRFADLTADLTTKLRDVDLVALQPYLIKAAETGVKRGTLALDLHATVKERRLHAPGSITLKQLELDNRGSSFMGMPRSAVVGLMKDRQGLITAKFVLEGKLDDPRFSLNESLATRFGAGVAESLGISIEGIARGAGSLGQQSLEAVGSAAKGIGQSVKGLFGE